MNKISKLTYFWKLLEEHKITIPIIQRDYAQGRRGKEDLRRNFLQELHAALTEGKELTLHFVYGTEYAGDIRPLDGQQRLTTLWLLHWYCCFRNNINRTDVIRFLKKFTYETRTSSKEFLTKMCDALDSSTFRYESYEKTAQKGVYTIANFIQDQTWFYAGWTQDPTIQAILRMLSGTFSKGENTPEGNKDGIEQIFTDDADSLKKLFDDNCPIKFFYLDMVGIQQSDDLYVKMNARGEQLTCFENFKADLIDALDKETDFKSYVDMEDKAGKCILNKLDSIWSDLFWNNCRVEKGKELVDKIDEVYFTFIKRFILNECLCSNQDENTKKGALKFLKDSEEEDYTDFKEYKKLLIDTGTDTIEKLVKTLDAAAKLYLSLKKCIDGIPLLKNKKYNYLPVYQYDEKAKAARVNTVSFQERIMNYGIDRYLMDANNFTENSLKHWLRVLANLVFAIEVPNEKEYLRRLAFVKRVADNVFNGNGNDIYQANLGTLLTSQAKDNTEEQLEEEIMKIDKINSDASLEQTIMNLESLWIFEGNISCLLIDELLRWDGLYDFLSKMTVGKNNPDENKNLRNLLKGFLCYYKESKPFIVMNDKHNGFRRLLNGELKDQVQSLLKDIKSGQVLKDIIKNYSGTEWQKSLINGMNDKDTWEWSYTWKVATVNSKVYLYQGTYHITDKIKELK